MIWPNFADVYYYSTTKFQAILGVICLASVFDTSWTNDR